MSLHFISLRFNLVCESQQLRQKEATATSFSYFSKTNKVNRHIHTAVPLAPANNRENINEPSHPTQRSSEKTINSVRSISLVRSREPQMQSTYKHTKYNRKTERRRKTKINYRNFLVTYPMIAARLPMPICLYSNTYWRVLCMFISENNRNFVPVRTFRVVGVMWVSVCYFAFFCICTTVGWEWARARERERAHAKQQIDFRTSCRHVFAEFCQLPQGISHLSSFAFCLLLFVCLVCTRRARALMCAISHINGRWYNACMGRADLFLWLIRLC